MLTVQLEQTEPSFGVSESISKMRYHYELVAYHSSQRHVLIEYALSQRIREKKPFEHWLPALDAPLGLWTIATAIRHYEDHLLFHELQSDNRINWTSGVQPRYDPDPLCDSILVYSNGALLWDFQMEHLYSTGVHPPKNSLPDSVSFRRGLNNKRAQTWDLLPTIKLPHGRSLQSVVEERAPTPYRFTRPHLSAAAFLFHLSLKSKQTSDS